MPMTTGELQLKPDFTWLKSEKVTGKYPSKKVLSEMFQKTAFLSIHQYFLNL
jgi:hypothetical protein